MSITCLLSLPMLLILLIYNYCYDILTILFFDIKNICKSSKFVRFNFMVYFIYSRKHLLINLDAFELLFSLLSCRNLSHLYLL